LILESVGLEELRGSTQYSEVELLAKSEKEKVQLLEGDRLDKIVVLGRMKLECVWFSRMVPSAWFVSKRKPPDERDTECIVI
jgi:hypothetical protein